MTAGAPAPARVRAEPLRASLVACVALVRSVDVDPLVSASTDASSRDLVLRVADAARAALAVCRLATDAYDHVGASTDEARDPCGEADLEVADIAFIGASELRPMLDRLESLGALGRDERLELCSRVLRRALKTLGALDAALARSCGSTSSLVLGTELLRSIDTRRHYARIRRNVVGQPVPVDAASARQTLERGRIHFSLLAASDAYTALRLGDRRQVDELSARMQALLAATDSPTFVADVTHLWQDVLGFARLVSAINRRQELVENDAAIISTAHEALRTLTTIPTKLRAQLDLLAGSHEEVDVLLERGEWDVASWRALIAELHEGHVRPVTGRFRVVPYDLPSGRTLG